MFYFIIVRFVILLFASSGPCNQRSAVSLLNISIRSQQMRQLHIFYTPCDPSLDPLTTRTWARNHFPLLRTDMVRRALTPQRPSIAGLSSLGTWRVGFVWTCRLSATGGLKISELFKLRISAYRSLIYRALQNWKLPFAESSQARPPAQMTSRLKFASGVQHRSPSASTHSS